ncbi:MAG: hypothetical protein HOQ05_03060 [Corynebacteriales bacterium]|nr:hypothetical protein [Mycobacteriales bacterium]
MERGPTRPPTAVPRVERRSPLLADLTEAGTPLHAFLFSGSVARPVDAYDELRTRTAALNADD